MIRRLALCILFVLACGPARSGHAQTPGQAPPTFRPPPFGGGNEREDFDDEVEELDANGTPIRSANPPPNPNGASVPAMDGGFGGPNEPLPPPMPTVRGDMNGFVTQGKNSNAIHFQVVEGEFYQKGKRRKRASDESKPAARGPRPN